MTDSITFDSHTISVAWHRPTSGSDTLVVLAHGAGGTMHTPQLKRFADLLCDNGIAALRFNFAYSELKKKAPDRTAVLEACYRAVVEAARAEAPTIFIGGRSMGGRIGSHIVAQGVQAAGLVFLAYPLHPPGKPERLRDEHLYTIDAPTLFLQGSRDPFAQPDLLDATIARLGARATLHVVDGGDHSHKVSGRKPDDVAQELADVTLRWIARVTR